MPKVPTYCPCCPLSLIAWVGAITCGYTKSYNEASVWIANAHTHFFGGRQYRISYFCMGSPIHVICKPLATDVEQLTINTTTGFQRPLQWQDSRLSPYQTIKKKNAKMKLLLHLKQHPKTLVRNESYTAPKKTCCQHDFKTLFPHCWPRHGVPQPVPICFRHQYLRVLFLNF